MEANLTAAPGQHRTAAPGDPRRPRQIDAGLSADRIQETQDAAKVILVAAARNDGDREFSDGYAAAVDTRLATLCDVQRAEADQLPWEHEQEAEREPEREAGLSGRPTRPPTKLRDVQRAEAGQL